MAIALDKMSRRGVPGFPAGRALTDGDLVTVGVQIDDDTADRIKAAAAADRRSVSAWCQRGHCAGPWPRPKPRRQARPDMLPGVAEMLQAQVRAHKCIHRVYPTGTKPSPITTSEIRKEQTMAIHKDSIKMKKERDAKKGIDFHASMSGPYLHVYSDYDIIPIEKVSGLEIVPVETLDHGTILRVNIRQRRGGAKLCLMNPSELLDLIGRLQAEITSDPTEIEASAAAIKETLYGKQQGYCTGCKVHLEPRMFEIDHVVPQSKGGASTLDNLQLLCSPCNKSKGNKTMAEWEAEKSAA